MQEDVIHIDSRSHLEVADSKHRYSKNLRLYFKEYDRLTNCKYILSINDRNVNSSLIENKWSRYDPFFEWLDNNENPPNLKDCPRSILDEDRVLYIDNEEERINYDIYIDIDGLWRKTLSNEQINTGSKGWIFVLSNGRMLGCEKRTISQDSALRFHHSSFFAGAPVHTAGMFVCNQGKLLKLFPHSGHYRPHDSHLFYLLAFLKNKNVNLHEVQVDVQRIIKAARNLEKDGSKSKKFDSALYCDGSTIYYFLKLKQKFHDSGLLNQINKLRDRSEMSSSGLITSNSSSDRIVADSSILTLNSSMLSSTTTAFVHTQSPVHKKVQHNDSSEHLYIDINNDGRTDGVFIDLKSDLITYIDEQYEKTCISPPKTPELNANHTNTSPQYISPSVYTRQSLVLQLPIVSDESVCGDQHHHHHFTTAAANRTRSGSQCSSGYVTPTKWDNDLKALLSESPMVPLFISSPITVQITKPVNIQLKSTNSTPRNSITERYHHSSSPITNVNTTSSTSGNESVEVLHESLIQNNHLYSSIHTHLYSKDIPIQTISSSISTPKPIRLMNSQLSWEESRDRSGSYSSTTAVGASSPNAFSPTEAHLNTFELNHDVFNNNNNNSNGACSYKKGNNIVKDPSIIMTESKSYIKEKFYLKNQTQLKENKSILPSLDRSNTSIVSSMSTQHVYRDSNSSTQQRIQHCGIDLESSQLMDKLVTATSIAPIDALSLNSSKIGFVIGSPAPSFSSSLSSADSLTTVFEENSHYCCNNNDNSNSKDNNNSNNIKLPGDDEGDMNTSQVVDDDLKNNASVSKTIKSSSSNINNNNCIAENNLNIHDNHVSEDVNDDEHYMFFGELEYNEKQNAPKNINITN